MTSKKTIQGIIDLYRDRTIRVFPLIVYALVCPLLSILHGIVNPFNLYIIFLVSIFRHTDSDSYAILSQQRDVFLTNKLTSSV